MVVVVEVIIVVGGFDVVEDMVEDVVVLDVDGVVRWGNVVIVTLSRSSADFLGSRRCRDCTCPSGLQACPLRDTLLRRTTNSALTAMKGLVYASGNLRSKSANSNPREIGSKNIYASGNQKGTPGKNISLTIDKKRRVNSH